MQTVSMQTITRVARVYLGMTQMNFAREVNLSQPDLCVLEQTLEPFGKIAKYQRISSYLGIPVDVLLRNDFTAIPGSFFEKFSHQPYAKVWNSGNHDLGRAGEEWVLKREQERVSESFPILAKLILPFFKMDTPSPGFDILSFDDAGKPFAIEVKTSTIASGSFRLTANEYASANTFCKNSQKYVVTYISNFGKDSQSVEDLPFGELRQAFRVQPSSYSCLRLPEPQAVSGITYYRHLRGIPQQDLAQLLKMSASNLSLVETGTLTLSASAYLQAANALGATVDDLLRTYPCTPEMEARV